MQEHTVASATKRVQISSTSAAKGYHKHVDGKVFTNTRRNWNCFILLMCITYIRQASVSVLWQA